MDAPATAVIAPIDRRLPLNSLWCSRTGQPEVGSADGHDECRLPRQETEQAQRNSKEMAQIARATGGFYYVGFPASNAGTSELKPLATTIRPNDQYSTVTGNPDDDFHKLLMTWLLGIICGVLCIEWLIRRLSRLA